MKYLKHRFVWASALALAFTITAQVQTMGLTNGTILILTRDHQDISMTGYDGDLCDMLNYRGAGQMTQGDAAMSELLGDYGYSVRTIICSQLRADVINSVLGTPGDPDFYLHAANPDFDVSLVILWGSPAGALAPPIATNGVPVMCGEHTTLSDRARQGSLFMYNNGSESGDAYGPAAGQYMKVLAPNHPVMQGIPLDAQGRVKIIRDAYAEENAHVPLTGYPNWAYCYAVQNVANAAPATTVLGVLDTDTNKSCFAVCDVGGLLSNGELATVRLVHFFVCEGGGNESRRCFNALSDLGRVIFVRAAKWAMGETLQPYKSLGIIDVTQAGPLKIKLSWQASADKSYKILGTANLFGPADFSNWETIQDMPGTSGVISRTLDISKAAQVAFLRVQQVP